MCCHVKLWHQGVSVYQSQPPSICPLLTAAFSAARSCVMFAGLISCDFLITAAQVLSWLQPSVSLHNRMIAWGFHAAGVLSWGVLQSAVKCVSSFSCGLGPESDCDNWSCWADWLKMDGSKLRKKVYVGKEKDDDDDDENQLLRV